MSKRNEFAEKKHSELEENSSRFYSWVLQWTVVKKFVLLHSSSPSIFSLSLSNVFFLYYSFPPSTSASVHRKGLSSSSWPVYTYHISQLAMTGWGMTWVGASCTSVEPVWKPVLNSQNLATWFSYIAIWWINSKVSEGLMITSENSSAARESSSMIILTSRLNRSLCQHERGSWHFWLSDLCTQWLMTADVLECSPTLRPPQFNDGTRP